jgi:hypothetical protein
MHIGTAAVGPRRVLIAMAFFIIILSCGFKQSPGGVLLCRS